jgi:hypothetical protein
MKRSTRIILVTTTAVALAGLFFLRSCQEEPTVSSTPETTTVTEEPSVAPFIRPVSASVDVPFTEYTVIAGRDTQLTFPSGSKINIPACAFAKDGNTLSGEQVILKYREFHSKSELVAAGIPMTMSGKNEEFLETTGMMELRAFQGEESLQVSEGCAVKIELANTEAGSKVNLYQLDEEKKSWIEKLKELPARIYTSAKKIKQPRFDESRYQKEALKAGYFKPVKPRVANPKLYSFHFKINLQQNPELNVYDGILWEYAGSGGNDDPAKNKWVQTATWREMKLNNTGREGIYQLTLSTREQTFTTIVRPVFEKEDMEYAKDVFNDRYAKYRKYMDKKNAEEAALRVQEAKRKKQNEQISLITRSFEINQFGIWNCDRYYTLPEPMVLSVNFNTADTSVKIDQLYIIEKNINSVIRMAAGKGTTTLKLNPTGQYELLVLDSEVKFHKISRESFEKELKKGSSITFPIAADGVEMKSVEDLKKWM